MKPTIILISALACALSPSLAAQITNDEFRTLISPERTILPITADKLNTARAVFSDPNKPGTLIINAVISHVEVQGVADGTNGEVTVSTPLALTNPDVTDGESLRRFGEITSLELVEKDNIIMLKVSEGMDMMTYKRDFKIQVPRDTNIIVKTNSYNSDRTVRIAGTDGEVDINIGNGNIALKNTTGAIAITTTSGVIAAELDEAPKKAITLATMTGNIDLALPASATANVRMGAKYYGGSVRTNFPEAALKMDTDPDATSLWDKAKFATETTGSENARLDAIRAEIARRRQERDGNATEPAIASTNSNKTATAMSSRTTSSTNVRAITGELNGGGIDIRLTTNSGTITLKQAK